MIDKIALSASIIILLSQDFNSLVTYIREHKNGLFIMAKHEISLGVEMGKLEIEPIQMNKNIKDENPFLCSVSQQKVNMFTKTCSQDSKCVCIGQKRNKYVSTIGKKKHKKILREPVLKLLQNSSQKIREYHQFISKKCSSSVNSNSDSINLCALVDNCNQLKISTESSEQNVGTSLNGEAHWWKTVKKASNQSRGVTAGRNQTGSCSHEALNPTCDITIDELASYFETLVHIPKKMSSMAEMMYI